MYLSYLWPTFKVNEHMMDYVKSKLNFIYIISGWMIQNILGFFFNSPEEKIRQLEKKVNELVEESCIANSCGDLKLVSP